MMSSDSESDEFYDAEEHASFDSFVSARSPGSASVCSFTLNKESTLRKEPDIQVPEIEEEERLLLELKRQAIEKWRKEDEELERRLRELQQKKIAEEPKTETHIQVSDLEHRRRKLEGMRQLIGEEVSSLKQSNDSSPDEDQAEEDVLNVTRSSPHKKSHTIEKMENSYRDTREHLHRTHSRKKRSGSWGDLPHNTSVLMSSYVETEKSRDVGASKNLMDNFNISVPDKENQDKLLQQYLSDDENNAELETLKVVDAVMKDSQLSVNAPDIVMSTKPRTPPAEFAVPVAPPRRKKSARKKASTSSFEGESQTQCVTPATPVSTVDSITKNFTKEYNQDFQCLELRDVISGTKMVTSEMAEVDAVKSQGDVNELLPQFSLEDATDDEVFGGSDDDRIHKRRRKERNKLTAAEKRRSSSPKASSSQQNLHLAQQECEKAKSDVEILESFFIKNLDTGEEIPLSKAAEELPQCINPVDLHIVQRTKEFKGDSHYNLSSDEDTISVSSFSSSISSRTTKKTKKLKKLLSRTARKVKNVADQVLRGDEGDVEEEVSVDGKIFKIKSSNSNKGPYDFAQIRMLQELSGEHVGAIWSMKFSPCGRLLATGGQDGILKIWVLKSAYSYFNDLRKKYAAVSMSPANSQESLTSVSSETASSVTDASSHLEDDDADDEIAPFMKKPLCCYRGHAADLLDVSWSKNYFILSSSMDKTVRLWHMSRRECLCTFQHIDFVTTIVFHPKDDRYFLSGSLDGKLRLWNIPDKKVTMWNEVGQAGSLITTANFVSKGKYAVVGTYDGRCIFYTTEHLKYFTQIHVRSTRGRNAKGHKITGIEPLSDNKMLVTSNDSRIRLYDLRDLTLSVKYKGATNTSSQIKASLSPSGKYIICGSEDHFIYVWKTRHDFKLSAARRDRNDYWEAIKVHNAVATVAIFAPNASLFYPSVETKEPVGAKSEAESVLGEIIISADFTGTIKVVRNYPQKL